MPRRPHRAATAVAAIILLQLAACDRDPAPLPAPVGGDLPVTTERLTGTTLQSATDGGGTTWTFTPTRVTIGHASGVLPAHVTEALGLPADTPSPVDAAWRLHGSGLVLTLSDFRPGPAAAGGANTARAAAADREVPIRPMGIIRVEINGVQYNLMRNAKSPLSPAPEPPPVQ